MSVRFSGRVVVIAGGARGIGFAAAQQFAEEGADGVAVIDLDAEQAKRAAGEISNRFGTPAFGLGANITRETEVQDSVSRIEEELGPVAVFVNTAAIVDDKRFMESNYDDWRKMVDVCLIGPMICLKAVLPGMVERKYGRVICLASDGARMGQARLSYYAGAKAGVIALVKSIAQELGSAGVTLNIVSPGATNTQLRQEREDALRREMGEDRYARRQEKVLRMYPLGRLGEPDDIAKSIAFLASDDASWITGQVLSVNGGFVMP